MCTHVHMLTAMSEATSPPAGVQATDELAVSTKRAAFLLGITRRYLYDLISAGEITTVRLPSKGGQGEHRIEITEIKAFLARNRQRVTP